MNDPSKNETRLHSISRAALIFSTLVWGAAFGLILTLDQQDRLWLKIVLLIPFIFSFYGAFFASRKTRILLAQFFV